MFRLSPRPKTCVFWAYLTSKCPICHYRYLPFCWYRLCDNVFLLTSFAIVSAIEDSSSFRATISFRICAKSPISSNPAICPKTSIFAHLLSPKSLFLINFSTSLLFGVLDIYRIVGYFGGGRCWYRPPYYIWIFNLPGIIRIIRFKGNIWWRSFNYYDRSSHHYNQNYTHY